MPGKGISTDRTIHIKEEFNSYDFNGKVQLDVAIK